jgi:hypothetical protein
MRVQIQLRIVTDDDTVLSEDVIACFDKGDDQLEGLRPSRWCKLGDGHQPRALGRGQRGNGCFIISCHASHGLQRQVTVL